jgi:hypothetical protein
MLVKVLKGRIQRRSVIAAVVEDLEPQILFVAQAVCAALDDTNLVVQTFHESKRHLVLWLAVGGDSIPMSSNHLSELLVGFQALPLEGRAPVLEEAPCPALTLVVPELAEGLLERYAVFRRLLAASSVLSVCLPSMVKFSRRESSVYF